MRPAPLLLPLLSLVLPACGGAEPPPAPRPAATPPPGLTRPDEPHLVDVRRLTPGGENAEAYWSWGGDQLIFQGRDDKTEKCDRIYRMSVADNPPRPFQVSNGKGTTTCSYFLPGDKEVIYASTQLGGDECPPRPDRSKGYVWALYDTYDIFRANADGTNIRQLTNTKGYDAEGTVCGKDGSIVFTSTRDGDIDLYRMDADGSNVKRLTDTPGYDGGAFFNADCTKIVWRASRPKPGKELDEFRALLAQGLVKPTKLEIYVANADGSDPVQITYLDAASFAPFWHPSQKRILFSSNTGDPKGREFDVWGVNTDGTGLEPVTRAPGFDGFPMFSPDGKWLAFSSNRLTLPGQHDTDVFLARWVETPVESPVPAADAPADRIMHDVAWLADPAREGRGVGTAGIDAAGAYLEQRFAALHLSPAGAEGFRQTFNVTTGIDPSSTASLELRGKALAADALVPLGFSSSRKVSAPLVFVGYGIAAKDATDLGVDDYKGVEVKGKIVVARRFVPETGKLATPEAQRRYGDFRYKAWAAREHGALGLIVVDLPVTVAGAKMPDEAPLPHPSTEDSDDAGIPVVVAKRDALAGVIAELRRGARVQATLEVSVKKVVKPAFNVVGRLASTAPAAQRLPGVVVVGAHYDHLGLGGNGSLAPDKHAPHLGADDNASGTSTMLEVARALAASPEKLRRDVLFIAFSGEETGVLGSTEWTRHPTGGVTSTKDVVAMLNMDMVGRMRANKLSVLGADSAAEWRDLAQPACDAARVDCTMGGDGYGPSDQTPFYAAGVPVLFFFTGAHADYHKPSDTADKVNAAGAGQVARIVEGATLAVSARDAALTYKSVPAPAPHGDTRNYGASLGTIPDYAGPPNGQKGVLLAGVRAGGAADQAGLRRGDILVKLGAHDIGSVEDFMYALGGFKPGEKVTAVVLRDGKEAKMPVTFQQARPH